MPRQLEITQRVEVHVPRSHPDKSRSTVVGIFWNKRYWEAGGDETLSMVFLQLHLTDVREFIIIVSPVLEQVGWVDGKEENIAIVFGLSVDV